MSNHEMETITVKVAKLGGRAVDVVVSIGTTVAQVLEAAAVTAEDRIRLYFNGSAVSRDSALRTGGLLVLSEMPSIKGARQ